MANLNFQQPPRIPSATLSRNNTSGFTSNSISGNVTPTSSLMFQSQQQPSSNSSFIPQSGQQLSPNRVNQLTIGGGSIGSIGSSGTPSLNRRIYPNPSTQQQQQQQQQQQRGFNTTNNNNSMGSFMMQSQQQQPTRFSGNNGINNFQVFGSTDTPPTLLDMSEFPSLTNARGQDPHSNVLQAPGSKPYGNNFLHFILFNPCQIRSTATTKRRNLLKQSVN
jgi:CCR4-NOT transcription complex subunit 2